jgi:superoxide dismutase
MIVVEDVSKVIAECKSVADIIRKLNLNDNGLTFKAIDSIISENNLDTKHFEIVKHNKGKSKYYTVERECKCGISFKTPNGGKRSKIFCSRSCANGRVWNEDDRNKKSESAKTSEKVKHANIKNAKIRKACHILSDITKLCVQCSIAFCNISRNSTKKTCSDKCKSDWISAYQRLLYADNRNYVAGGTSKWLPYKDIKVQGSYELRVCYILDTMLDKNEILSWEYTNDRFPYIGIDGTTHTYLLDFKVERNDGSFYYIETKGYTKDNDFCKWQAVSDYGNELIVWYLKDIELAEKLIQQ